MSILLKSKLSPALASDNLSPKLIGVVWGIVFLFKLLMAFYYHKITVETHPEIRLGSISLASGDNESYLGSMDNYIKTGNYFFINPKGDTVRAGRSPYYALPYLAARQFLSVGKSADMLTLINISLDATAIICISLLAMSFLNIGKFIFLFTSFLGAISLYVSSWNIITVPDSPAASLLMIGLYFLFKLYRNKRFSYGWIILSTVCFTWAVMLRPFLALVVFFICVL